MCNKNWLSNCNYKITVLFIVSTHYRTFPRRNRFSKKCLRNRRSFFFALPCCVGQLIHHASQCPQGKLDATEATLHHEKCAVIGFCKGNWFLWAHVLVVSRMNCKVAALSWEVHFVLALQHDFCAFLSVTVQHSCGFVEQKQ